MSGFLSPYRVVDLTDARGLLAGRMLAQLGAEVIQVEPPGGSPARRVGPFDEEGRSLYWATYAAGKRSLVCDLDSDHGRAALLALLDTADIVIDSAPPGWMAERGLDHAQLAVRNPSLVSVSITPFGSSGPKARYADSDLILWAAGGALWPSRDNDDRGPVRISVPQAYLHAAADAAGGALVALFARHRTGRGQHVEISAQRSVMQATLSSVVAAIVDHRDFVGLPSAGDSSARRALDLSGSGSRTRRSKWRIIDGLAEMHLAMGPSSGRSSNNLFAWIAEAGELPARFRSWDWVALPERFKCGEVDAADLEAARDAVAAFLQRRTKEEVLHAAMYRRILIAPVCTTRDIVQSRHHAERRFFESVHDGEKRHLLPGPFARGAPWGFAAPRPAPSLGELNMPSRRRRSPGPHASRRPQPADRPLEGLKVLDLSWVVAGPAIGRVLADYGATVVRVESSRRVETARLMGPFPDGRFDVERSGLYDNNNANKLGLTVDLAAEPGRALTRRLARWADVVVESFTPGQMAKWGMSFDELRKSNPSLIMLSTSLMGQSGPYAALSGYGNIGAAMAGYQSLVGWPDKLPVGPFGPYTDFVGPRFGLVALLAALDHRRRKGEGAWLDISQVEAGIQFLAPQIACAAAGGPVASAAGNHDPDMAPHGVYRCRENTWAAVAVRSDAEWLRLARHIGNSDLAEDPRLATLAGRKAYEPELDLWLSDWASVRSAADVEAELQAIGIPAHRVASTDDIAVDPQLRHLRHFIELPHPRGGRSVIEASRFSMSATPAEYRLAAPTFGRDNGYVLREILGCSREEIRALTEAGVLT